MSGLLHSHRFFTSQFFYSARTESSLFLFRPYPQGDGILFFSPATLSEPRFALPEATPWSLGPTLPRLQPFPPLVRVTRF